MSVAVSVIGRTVCGVVLSCQLLKFSVQRSMTSHVTCGPSESSCTSC